MKAIIRVIENKHVFYIQLIKYKNYNRKSSFFIITSFYQINHTFYYVHFIIIININIKIYAFYLPYIIPYEQQQTKNTVLCES